ncbi:MAG TPA: hypothetical protein VLD40_06930 [Dissulfurispiraceae bacterium]|nr:hypothetical protein [Dissulfurispiraceae bacterium]
MFLYRGWQAVEKGTYWDPDTGKKIVMNDSGLLPANRKETYFKLPESFLLIPMLLLGLALSIAFPFGIGVALFVCMFVLYRIMFALMSRCEESLGGLLAGISASYRPNVAFFRGKAQKRKTGGKSRAGKTE